jgi:hypothetical protein
VIDEIVGAGVRALALKHHPDRTGGSHDRVVAINRAAEWLRQAARALT